MAILAGPDGTMYDVDNAKLAQLLSPFQVDAAKVEQWIASGVLEKKEASQSGVAAYWWPGTRKSDSGKGWCVVNSDSGKGVCVGKRTVKDNQGRSVDQRVWWEK